MILTLIYIIGYVCTWRYAVGYILDETSSVGYRDGMDYSFSVFFGSIANLIWPLLVVCRAGYVLCVKYFPTDFADTFFPGPKEIESREERHERIMTEQREAMLAQRRYVNDKERELGIEVTRWEDATW